MKENLKLDSRFLAQCDHVNSNVGYIRMEDSAKGLKQFVR